MALLRRAVARDRDREQHDMAQRLLVGNGVAKDEAEAVRLLRLAVAQGHGQFAVRLGAILNQGAAGQPKDEAAAARLYRLAATQGMPDAQVNLGRMYSMGEGVERNPEEAARWYRMAAQRGSALGQQNLAVLTRNGEAGTVADPVAERPRRGEGRGGGRAMAAQGRPSGLRERDPAPARAQDQRTLVSHG